MILGFWEFLFKYPPVVFEKGRLIFASPLPWWMLTIAVALAAFAAWSYLRARRGLGERDRAVLIGLRVLTLTVLLIVLFRPVLQIAVAVPQENYLGVLIDDSRSMRIADGDQGPRGAQVQRGLDAEQSRVLAALAERFRLRLFRFSGSTERVSGIDDLTFMGGQSQIGHALDQARAELAGVPLSGLVLISDGADRAEADLNASLLGLRTASVPVYTVGVGREEFRRDIEVRRASTPRSVLRGTSLVVDVVVAQTGYAGRSVTLVVEDEGKIVSSQEVELPLDGTPAAVRVNFEAAEPGWRRFRFRVPVLEDELVPENNQQESLIEVRDGPHKILYLEGEPRWEVKFMRMAVARDPQLQLVLLQRSAEDKFYRLGVDSAAELAAGFPRTREELFSYRAIVLGSVEAGFFSREQLQLISDFVSERGGSLLTLGGRRSFSEGGYAGTPLAGVLPVELDGREDSGFFTEVSVSPTRLGAGHAVLQLAEDPAASAERWRTLPPLSTFNRVTRLKPGATALLTGSGPGVPANQVVLASQRFGRGLSVSFPVQDSWMWQMHADIPLEDQTHEIFWGQMLRWLVNDVPGQLAFDATAEPAAVGEPVSVRVEVRDPAYRTIADAAVTASIEAPDGTVRELPMSWTAQRDGEYRTSFVPEATGLHRVRVRAERGDSLLVNGTLGLDAVDDQGEYFSAQMRAPLLRRIAEETGGRFYPVSDLNRLPEEIRYSGQGVTEMERYDLWDMPILFFLLVGLVAGEWGYRRKRGLP
ncbi:MAG TPA: hypothetical protein VFR81_17295 [Longimicrobium sp.]|nr:hypothetical protein [Longimicrobium sp.]